MLTETGRLTERKLYRDFSYGNILGAVFKSRPGLAADPYADGQARPAGADLCPDEDGACLCRHHRFAEFAAMSWQLRQCAQRRMDWFAATAVAAFLSAVAGGCDSFHLAAFAPALVSVPLFTLFRRGCAGISSRQFRRQGRW